MSKQKELTFEESLESLEGIVEKLEGGDLSLEESLELFENGVKLASDCQKKLDDAERRIEVLVRDSKGDPVIEPLEELGEE